MTVYVHNRRYGQRRGQQPVFRTRAEGYNRSRRVWICMACRAWHDTAPPAEGRRSAKPNHCQSCGERKFLYFDSKGEALRFMQLWFQQDHGTIGGLKHHPRYPIVLDGPSGHATVCVYEADSEYIRDGEKVVEDFKPKSPEAQDPVFKLKQRLFEHQYAIRVRIVS